MAQETIIKVKDIDIDVITKNIKNIHIAVYPPDARVRISAPQNYSIATIKDFALSKLTWIKDNIEVIKKQKRVEPKDYVSGESHYLFGRRLLLVRKGCKETGLRYYKDVRSEYERHT